MRTSEELIETLEENLVAVQNMMTSKYIAFFLTEVSAWQKTLSTVDLVISRWTALINLDDMLIKVVWGSENMVLPRVNLHWIRGHPRPAARRFQSLWHCGQRLQGPHGGDGEDTKCGEGNKCRGTFRKAAGVDAEFVKVREGTCRISGNEETCISKVIQCLSFDFSSKGSILPPLPTCWIFFPTGIILQKWRSIWPNCSTGA